MAALTPDKLLERLAKGKPVPNVLLLGEDAYLRDLCRDKLIEAYVPEGGRAWGVARFSAADDPLDRALAQAQTLPMLVPRQLVFVEEVEALERLGEEAREAAVERLAAYLDDPAPFTVLVLEATQLDQRMKLFRTVGKKLLVVAVELGKEPEDREAAAAAMTFEMAGEMGIQLARDTAEELAESCDADLTRIHSELTKIATYAGERREITRADVEALVISAKKYSVWQFAEMLASRQRSRALEFLESLLREGEQPAGLVGAMAWMYRKLIEAQELPTDLSGWQAARQLGMRPETAELALLESHKIPRALLLDGLQALYEADSRLKSGAVDDHAVMEFLVSRLTHAAAASGD